MGWKKGGVTRKRSTKKLKHTGNLFRENPVTRCLLILDLKAIYIIGQSKAFYRQRVSESSCARKETVDINILVGMVTSRNDDKKLM